MTLPKFLIPPNHLWKTLLIASTASLGVAASSLHSDNREKTKRAVNPIRKIRNTVFLHDGMSLPRTSIVSTLAASILHNFLSPKTALCSASPQKGEDASTPTHFSMEKYLNVNAYGSGDPKTYYYKRMRGLTENSNLLDRHAIFGALRKPGHVERFDAYRRVRVSSATEGSNSNEFESVEICAADVRIGEKLNGHDGIVHGGIISLMLDETFGWSYIAMCLNRGFTYQDAENGDIPFVVTANLTVNYRAPLPAGSNVVIRVRHEKKVGRKLYFSARMESPDGSILYSEATALFITVQKQHLKN